MPELPDLEVFAANLQKRFKSKTLETLEVKVAKKLNVSIQELKNTLEGHQLEKVSRSGKTLQLHFKNEAVLGLHLMLHGELRPLNPDEEVKFQIVSFHFKGGDGFALCDFQKQATPTLNPELSEVPDALALNEGYLRELLGKKKVQIKTLLMDQQLIRGIGNTYADEILWEAKISPFSIAKFIPESAVNELLRAINHVLCKETVDIGKKLCEALNGEVKDFLRVHRSDLSKSPTGAEIQIEKKGARKTYFTDEQLLYTV
ncbi:DNA-formamidopyrimidine glycosylase family protein [Pedobacter sp. MC2016-24]|uniref:DNA-formamidopyrimidine glycosylase family protein n=1 Tax=Pedobacter sp. MC2016-24 TaxID=2780090 RepID=UPI001882D098|nr:DNA-formamidopyrimidine glycosylase family protein [Pedobacter sp. MC2016-24]MBE9600802.1 formamidopyrimidine-DNA glycosylase [Pedobacter sp. MC2016-24]